MAQNDKNSIRGNSQTKMAFKAMDCHAKFAYALFARNDDLTRFVSSNQCKKKAYLAYPTLYQKCGDYRATTALSKTLNSRQIIVLLVFQSTHQGRLWFQLVCLAFSRRFLAFQSLILSHLWAFLCLAIYFHRHLKLNLPR